METVISVVALIALLGVLSSLIGRRLTRKRALWVWDNSTAIGWVLIVVGVVCIGFGFLVDRSGTAMSVKLAFGSLLLIAGTWLIW